MKTGILTASFGTTYQETREKNIEAVERSLKEQYPQAMCYRGFSSGIVRKILKERDGLFVMDIREALEKMKEDGITHAYVQLTHIIDGIESNRVKDVVNTYRGAFEVVAVGEPLLTDEADYEKVVRTLWAGLCPEDEDKILVFMGHGTSHEANESYTRLERTFHRMGHPEVYVAAVEAEPAIEDVIAAMDQREKKPVILTPLMLVAGDHAVNDMAGSEEDSFLSLLTEAGYEVEVVLKGLGEYEGIREIYGEHLKNTMKHIYK